MNFLIKVEPEALQDIQEAIYWYDRQQPGLGRRFYDQLNIAIDRLKQNPYYQIRYRSVRCLPLAKFPFMIHYSVDETNSIIFIWAIFNTSLNPKRWMRNR